VQCPVCSHSLEEFRIAGKLKCAYCYQTFSRLLEAVLLHYHGALEHCGLYPLGYERIPSQRETRQYLDKLEEELQSVLKVENYEAAAIIKRKIDTLRKPETKN